MMILNFLPFLNSLSQVANKGYVRLTGEDEEDWMGVFSEAHNSVKGGTRYNTGKLLMVLTKPVDTANVFAVEDKNGESKFVSGKDENTLV